MIIRQKERYTTALYYTTMKCIRNGQGGVVKMFFKSFKDNFKQATGIGILALIAGFICVFDMYFAINKNLKSMMVIFTIMSLIYLFPHICAHLPRIYARGR